MKHYQAVSLPLCPEKYRSNVMLDAYDMMTIIGIVMLLLASNETRLAAGRQNLNIIRKRKACP